ncbi:helix-turn-helix transcriptional regulator [Baekduia soli]|uniref:Helix-turn-helix transcriptional regulator n=1 Tax=Baekduia soli TaxID=496014 RepID=A0A5B8U4F6_9ACTN|nr:helix-turn-helix transcriptional regulator [Baekduia soli]QEC47765.1 helix-turn-helix transcriptional regulator [Baekduia soli]
MRWTVERLIEEIDLLGARGLPREEFFAELSPRLRNVIDNDASCWHTLDPSTRLLTADAPKELIERGVFAPEATPAAGELIVRSEYMVDDVNTFAGLAARRVPVGILDHVTRGDPRRSARYRDLLLPAGIPHELRAAFVIRGRAWGAVHIARRASSGAFQQRDADALAALTGAIARGIRASLRFDAARRVTGAEAPGMVVLGPGDEVELITPPARDLLASLHPREPRCTGETIPTPVLALASFVRSAPDGGQGGGNVVTVPGGDGWVTLHASRPGPHHDGRVAVVLEPARGARSATVRLEAFGATARERDVATLLARGLSRAEIAEALVLSPHTVEDHVKSLYDKVGVGSRQELVARVFLDEYLPEVVRQTPLTSRGRFDRG